jgi:hypothetical protein
MGARQQATSCAATRDASKRGRHEQRAAQQQQRPRRAACPLWWGKRTSRGVRTGGPPRGRSRHACRSAARCLTPPHARIQRRARAGTRRAPRDGLGATSAAQDGARPVWSDARPGSASERAVTPDDCGAARMLGGTERQHDCADGARHSAPSCRHVDQSTSRPRHPAPRMCRAGWASSTAARSLDTARQRSRRPAALRGPRRAALSNIKCQRDAKTRWQTRCHA